jgi:hypothetical protein
VIGYRRDLSEAFEVSTKALVEGAQASSRWQGMLKFQKFRCMNHFTRRWPDRDQAFDYRSGAEAISFDYLEALSLHLVQGPSGHVLSCQAPREELDGLLGPKDRFHRAPDVIDQD